MINVTTESQMGRGRRSGVNLSRYVFSGGSEAANLDDVQELWRSLRYRAQGVAEHRLAEGTGGADDRGAGGYQLLYALNIDALALLFAEEHLAAAGAATEGTLTDAARIDPTASRKRLAAPASRIP